MYAWCSYWFYSPVQKVMKAFNKNGLPAIPKVRACARSMWGFIRLGSLIQIEHAFFSLKARCISR